MLCSVAGTTTLDGECFRGTDGIAISREKPESGISFRNAIHYFYHSLIFRNVRKQENINVVHAN